MLTSLTRLKRMRAGWIVALIYLLCVLAPTISYALPGKHAVAPCLADENHVPGVVHWHNEMPTQHAHKDGHVHDHSGGHSHANADSDHDSMPIALNGNPVPRRPRIRPTGNAAG
jgi:hypothetical protein